MSQNDTTVSSEGLSPSSLQELNKSSNPLLDSPKDLDNRNIQENSTQPNKNDRREPREGGMKRADSEPVFTESLESVSESRKKLHRTVSQTYDGVFSNLNARPEIMVLPKDSPPSNDPPPPYTAAALPRSSTGDTMYVSMDEMNLADCIDDVYLDDYMVGSVFGFVVSIVIVLLFQVYGFVVSFVLSHSHSTRLGSIAGLGLLLAIGSFSLEAELVSNVPPSLQPWIPVLCVLTGVFGYGMFIYGIASFQRVRKLAESIATAPTPQALYSRPATSV